MKTSTRYLTSVVAVILFSFVIPGLAVDFGNPKEVQQVRKAVPKKLGKVLNISVAHDWALCTTYSDENALSVVLHRAGTDWKVTQSDGGAYAADGLRALGVPKVDIPALLKVYQ